MSASTLRLVVGSSVAAAMGVTAVGFGAYQVERIIPMPQFSLTGERFDLSTFMGRWAKQLSNCDPSTLLASEAEIKSAVSLLSAYSRKDPAVYRGKISDKELWSARKLKESAVHPDTGEIIPMPFRMAGYVPFNGPICVAMMASTSTAFLLFWNWVNQTQNALVNYYNRNASSPTSNETLAKSYTAAVTAALTVAFGGSQFIKRTFSPSTANALLKFVAFPSSIVASTSNCYIMRRPEKVKGIQIMDKEGNVVANGQRSTVAASKAVNETVLSRAGLQVPVFFVPALTMSLPPVVALCNTMPNLFIPMTTLITMIAFGFGLPATVAIFPQLGTLEKSKLEPSLRDLVQDEVVYYNKGL